MDSAWRVCLIFGLLVGLLTAPFQAMASDVHLLIDVSGSMKQNDPNNLRVPALRLVSELAPLNADMGVWLFSERPEVLVPFGKVNARWKTTARNRLSRIHSRGQFTDIEAALTTASAGWSAATDDDTRHIVLLTDGLVDVAPPAADQTNNELNAASRSRILNKLLPELKQAGVKLHVIALSDQVDNELMTELTAQSGGWLEHAKDAAALQRAFLRLLEQTSPPITVPIQKDNRFTIDASVTEFTLLAFRRPDRPIELVTPAKETLSADRHDKTVAWRKENDYDLVTISAPATGEWQLQGSLDPDNRVAVLTDLGMEMTAVPVNIPAQAPAWPLNIWLTDHGQRVTRIDFLQLAAAKASLIHAPDTNKVYPISLALDPQQANYHANVAVGNLPAGDYQLQAQVIGGTFQRQLTRQLRIAAVPIEINYTLQLPTAAQPQATLQITVTLDPSAVSSVSGYVHLTATTAQASDLVINFDGQTQATAEYWLPLTQPGEYQARARLQAMSLAGVPLAIAPPDQRLTLDFPAVSGADDAAASRVEAVDWPQLGLMVGGANILFLVLLWLVFRLTRPKLATDANLTSATPTGRRLIKRTK
ncbi:VWA domain-containing protein [Rhodoferax sp. 4810]|nr:VWA domain-containing protein [Rhodoferax jenense]